MKQFNFSLVLGPQFLQYLIDLQKNGILVLDEETFKLHYVIEVDNAQLRSPTLIYSEQELDWIPAEQQNPEDPSSFLSNFVSATTFEISRKYLDSVVLKVWVYVNRESYSDALLVAVATEYVDLNPIVPGTELVPFKLAPPMSFEDAPLNRSIPFESFSVPVKFSVIRKPHARMETVTDDHLTLEHFSIQSALGKGSFGEVLLVRERSTNRPFALKSMVKGKSRNTAGVPRILEEVRVLKPLYHRRGLDGTESDFKAQSFLIQLKYSFQSKTHAYFVTNAVLGGSLLDFLQFEGHLEEPDACFYGVQVIFALQYMHKHNIIHRDIKLENILLDVNGYAKICDFGLSSFGDLTRTSFCGTGVYMSPEILQQKAYTNSVDWWALGVLLFELIAGGVPFNDEKAILKSKAPIPSNLSTELRHVMEGLLDKDPLTRLNFDDLKTLKATAPFDNMELEGILNQRVITPFKPYIQHNFDPNNFEGSQEEVSVARIRSQAKMVGARLSIRASKEAQLRLSGFDFDPSRGSVFTSSMYMQPPPITVDCLGIIKENPREDSNLSELDFQHQRESDHSLSSSSENSSQPGSRSNSLIPGSPTSNTNIKRSSLAVSVLSVSPNTLKV